MPVFCNNCGQENRDTSRFCSGCGGTLQPSSPSGPLASGTLLENRYKIVTLIKAGGMGAVYKAIDEKLDRVCAVKELLPPYGASPQELIQSAEWFKREAKLLAKLSNANLPAVIDYFTHNGRYYLAMEFIEGTDLETLLQRDGSPGLPVEKVIDWSKQILIVLEYLHSQNPPIVYRDIKPANIMLHKDGRAMLIDFGIARVVNEVSKTKKTAIGTAGYAPVEQCRGEAEPRSDLYALGASMHHLISGVEPLPFRFELLSKHVSAVSSDLNNIVMKALKDNIVDRFASAREMRTAIDGLSNGKTHPPVINVPQPPPTAPMKQSLISPVIKPQVIVKQSENTPASDDLTGWTLHKAVKEGNLEIAKILISKGADVNAKDNGGDTPLHWAALMGFKEIAELLISKGADVNTKSNSGSTPLSVAKTDEIKNLLISHGAKSSSCFITTAVCSSLHKPDDCYELNTFRKFRDEWLQYQPDGEYLIDEYYAIAPAIVKAINNMPQKDEIYKIIWAKYLSKCLSMIEAKNFEGAKKVYIKMVNSLKGVKNKK